MEIGDRIQEILDAGKDIEETLAALGRTVGRLPLVPPNIKAGVVKVAGFVSMATSAATDFRAAFDLLQKNLGTVQIRERVRAVEIVRRYLSTEYSVKVANEIAKAILEEK